MALNCRSSYFFAKLLELSVTLNRFNMTVYTWCNSTLIRHLLNDTGFDAGIASECGIGRACEHVARVASELMSPI